MEEKKEGNKFKENPCQKYACSIQSCLQRYNFDSKFCKKEIDIYLSCKKEFDNLNKKK